MRHFHRPIRSLSRTQTGFTLVEMMVALMVVSWVLSSSYIAIAAFSDQRVLMQKRFLGQSVAWNELMQRYRLNRGWIGESNFSALREAQGIESEHGVQWHWHFQQESALGRGVVKQTVNVYEQDIGNQESATPSATLVLFQIEQSYE